MFLMLLKSHYIVFNHTPIIHGWGWNHSQGIPNGIVMGFLLWNSHTPNGLIICNEHGLLYPITYCFFFILYHTIIIPYHPYIFTVFGRPLGFWDRRTRQLPRCFSRARRPPTHRRKSSWRSSLGNIYLAELKIAMGNSWKYVEIAILIIH